METQTEPKVETHVETQVDTEAKPSLLAKREIGLNNGMVAADSFEQQYRAATVFFKSRMLPKHFSSIEMVVTGMQLCYELGIKPITGLRNVCIINGTPSIWGDLPLALVRRSKQLESIVEEIFDKDGNRICPDNKNLNAEVFAAVCAVKRVGMPNTCIRTFTYEQAVKANLTGKDTWKYYRGRMLQMRARSHALKDEFGDILMGVSIAEYDHNATMMNERLVGEHVDEGVSDDPASSLNEQFGQEPKTMEV